MMWGEKNDSDCDFFIVSSSTGKQLGNELPLELFFVWLAWNRAKIDEILQPFLVTYP